MNLKKILGAYQLDNRQYELIEFGSGLINRTWKLSSTEEDNGFLLQKLNTTVFKNPELIADNLRSLAFFLRKKYPQYLFVAPTETVAKEGMYLSEEREYFRLFPFIANSYSIDVVNNTKQAHEAAKQFALFTKVLVQFPTSKLNITLANFHDLELRFEQFKTALKNANTVRISAAKEVISFLQEQSLIVTMYKLIKQSPEFKSRVTHHDTKISNVLFTGDDEGLCVIDLDTVMPGYFISDVGDMMRTYLSPANEEEEVTLVNIREEYFRAIVNGYLSEMQDELSELEKGHFVYAGKFMIYMQALRFLTDYLNNDLYYSTRYEGQNLVRAKNQAALLKQFINKEARLDEIVIECKRHWMKVR
jgi:hypothetical protein